MGALFFLFADKAEAAGRVQPEWLWVVAGIVAGLAAGIAAKRQREAERGE